jgi:DNA polymerase/3'-5' exonuclease PolX
MPHLDLRTLIPAAKSQTGKNNDIILTCLEKLIDGLTANPPEDSSAAKSHRMRLMTFRTAVNAIKDYPDVILSGAQAKDAIPGIGKGIADRIDECLSTGTLKELKLFTDKETALYEELCTVTGIGIVRAKGLVTNYGVKSVADLKEKYKTGEIKIEPNGLTHHIIIGLEYYDDIQERFPRAEADKLIIILEKHIKAVDPTLVVNFCGSYRRGKPTCGDLDVILSGGKIDEPLMKVIEHLHTVDFLVGDLTQKGTTKYMGVCKRTKKGKGRRIDIRYIPTVSLGAALLYFTGSGEFNKLMRNVANQRGYTLNEYGLYRLKDQQKNKGDLIPAETEEAIFQCLNLLYLRPTERDF